MLSSIIFFLNIHLLFPTYTRYIGEFICFFLCIILILLYSLYGFHTNKSAFIICFFFIFLLILSLLSDINRVISRDLLEFFRPLYWISSFSLFYIVCSRLPSNKIVKILINIISILSVWGILESIINVPHIFHLFYKLDENVYYKKAITSLIAPYSYGAIIGVGFIFYYFKFKYTSKFYYLFMYSVCFIAIVLSQSKSCIIATLFISSLLFVFEYTFITLLVIPIFCYLSYFLYFHTSYLFYLKSFISNTFDALSSEGFSSFLNSSDSISNRLDQIIIAFSNLNTLPFFGSGIGKEYLYIESLFLIIYRYGIFGVILFITIITYTYCCCRKIQLLTSNITLYCFSKSFIYCILFLIISSFSANLIDQFRVCLIYFGIIGILISSHNKFKKLV